MVILPSQYFSPVSKMRLSDYEAGKVAEKDLIVPVDLSYVDEEATA